MNTPSSCLTCLIAFFTDGRFDACPLCNGELVLGPLRLVVSGDRNWYDSKAVEDVLDTLPMSATVVIEGEARGLDLMFATLARQQGFQVLPFPADWESYGLSAGWKRNQQMIDEGKPHFLIWFHDDLSKSKGTKDMVTRCTQQGLPVFSYKEWLDAHKGNRVEDGD